ncbi:hypothetical protein HMI54_012790 [Coelomomyces lativittatus]|nr:hypothetical protein HMI55_000104 [Coelomomyces lativittatus]KAJ1509967.1 hypothetical protein HMI56_006558 [Coelomomyces lativittatus]KAJ1515159.1 hypothetical protein HMI54_012790 [Coelomomyces lativittatus]
METEKSYDKLWVGASLVDENAVYLHPSCFVAKLLFILDLYNIEYGMNEKYKPKWASEGKLPNIVQNGHVLEDSRFILDWLKINFKVDPDASLSLIQKAISHGFVRMLEKSFHFYLLYFRWQKDEGFAFTRTHEFSNSPWYLRWIAPHYVRQLYMTQLQGQGTGHLSEIDALHLAEQDLMALSNWLGHKKNFFDTPTPTLLDIVTFSVLSTLHFVPFEDALSTLLQKFRNLTLFLERMLSEHYPKKYEIFTSNLEKS